MDLYADVVLPLALPQNFTYRIPPHLNNEVQKGMRVIVPLGKRKLYTALIKNIHSNAPEGYHAKDILEVEDRSPIVNAHQLKLWEWIAEYYMCSQGEVMTAALPAGLKLESETIILRNHLKKIVDDELNDPQYLIIEALESQNSLSIKEISEIIGIKNPLRIVQQLLGMRYILLQEEIKSGYRPKIKRYVEIAEGLSEKDLPLIFEELEKAPKQKELLLFYYKLQNEIGRGKPLSAARLLKESNASDGSLKALEKKGIINIFIDKDIKDENDFRLNDLKQLTENQNLALNEVTDFYKTKDTVLLHGVTSSGKTEIYVKLIDDVLREGKQVLYLVPEIALTTQLIGRLQKYFGDKVLIYHSRFSDRERVECWLKMVENPENPIVVIGARSSIFLPFSNLGLIIVDEEHESSFKQYEPAPRYHARDTAIVLARMHKAYILLGSATPSFESYYNAQCGKYGLVELNKRFGDLPLPEIQCIDLTVKRKKKQMLGHFSDDLLNEIKAVLAGKKQVILFQNRRGFTTMVQCNTCGNITQCKNCDISLTYHKHIDLLRCHYCGYSRQVPQKCPSCNSPELKSFGFGTEKLEDDLRLMLENSSIQRMDLDSTRKKNAYENIINDFEDGSIDILVGTQMVTKGLDFENVALVGIMNADAILKFPDFRSHERAYQLMAQVAGRAGRKGNRGKVLIQTSEPYHQVIRKVMDNNYLDMYKDEIYERKSFKYPPFYRLIRITLKHKDSTHLASTGNSLGSILKNVFGDRVLGPEFALVPRVRNKYQMEIIIKLEEKVSLKKAKIKLRDTAEGFFTQYPGKKIQVIYDVDPY